VLLICTVFACVSLALNLPPAYVNFTNWSTLFTVVGAASAGSNFWVVLPALSTPVDIGHFAVSFLILYSLRFNVGELIGWQNAFLRTPLELARDVLSLAAIGFGLARAINVKTQRRMINALFWVGEARLCFD